MPTNDPEQKPKSIYQAGRDPLDFDDFLNAVGTGSSRSRSIIGWLMTAAFIAMLALLNAYRPELNWFASRLITLQNASHWIRFSDDKVPPNDSIQIPGSSMFVANAFSRDGFWSNFAPVFNIDTFNVAAIHPLPPHIRLTVPRFLIKSDGSIDTSQVKPNLLFATLVSVSTMRYATRSEFDFQIRSLNRARIENALLIKIPILGITFDVNWLSNISGAAYCILFFLLYHSLARERKNLILLFRMADDRNIERVSLYQLLAMQQVLAVPHSIDEYLRMFRNKKKHKLAWYLNTKDFLLRIFSFVPIFVPLMVSAIICYYDSTTMDLGSAVNGHLARNAYYCSLYFLLGTLLLFSACFYEWVRMHMLWKKEAHTIRDMLYEGIEAYNLGVEQTEKDGTQEAMKV